MNKFLNGKVAFRAGLIGTTTLIAGTVLAQVIGGPTTMPATAPVTMPTTMPVIMPTASPASVPSNGSVAPATGPSTSQPTNNNGNNTRGGGRESFGRGNRNGGGNNGNGNNSNNNNNGRNEPRPGDVASGPANRAGPMARDYDILLNRTIFSKTRAVSQPREGGNNNPRPETTMPPAARPERNMVFNGVALGTSASAALIEDTTAGKVLWLKTGDAVARGHVKSIGFDELEYIASDGRVTKVLVGQTLDGSEPPPVSSRTLGVAPVAPTVPGQMPGIMSPQNSVLERLRQARMRESGGGGATTAPGAAPTTPPGPGGPGSVTPGGNPQNNNPNNGNPGNSDPNGQNNQPDFNEGPILVPIPVPMEPAQPASPQDD